ncbi:hypothetical protein DFH28DRAFT_971769 [Melampsora americana]|nr:hypothetical protein DFH28DRAFT_971769 [Melampsora americana]
MFPITPSRSKRVKYTYGKGISRPRPSLGFSQLDRILGAEDVTDTNAEELLEVPHQSSSQSKQEQAGQLLRLQNPPITTPLYDETIKGSAKRILPLRSRRLLPDHPDEDVIDTTFKKLPVSHHQSGSEYKQQQGQPTSKKRNQRITSPLYDKPIESPARKILPLRSRRLPPDYLDDDIGKSVRKSSPAPASASKLPESRTDTEAGVGPHNPKKPSKTNSFGSDLVARRSLKRSISLGDRDQALSRALRTGHTPESSSGVMRQDARQAPLTSKQSAYTNLITSQRTKPMSRTISSVSLEFPMSSNSCERKSSRLLRSRKPPQVSDENPNDAHADAPKDLSDIFAVLESETTRVVHNRTSPKRPRLSQMTTRSYSASGILSPPHSPVRSPVLDSTKMTPSKHISHSWGAASDLDPSQPSTHSVVGSTGRTLARHVSSDILGLSRTADTINCVNVTAALGPSGYVQKTYGAQRTCKEDEDEVNMLLPIKLDGYSSSSSQMKPRETYSDLRKKWGVDEDEEEPESQPDLRTISHQRAAGSSKRFVDELSYLFEGLSGEQQSDLDLKRVGALELIRKFIDPGFVKDLKTNGMIEQFYEVLRSAGAGDGDAILDLTLLVFVAVLCCEHQSFLEPVLRIVPKNSTDPLSTQSDSKKASPKTSDAQISKRESKYLGDIAEIVKDTSLANRLNNCTNTSILALFSVASISAFLPRPGLLPQRAIIQSGAYHAVLACLLADGRILEGRLEAYMHGSDLLPPQALMAVYRVTSCMDVIEACTICEEDGIMVLERDQSSLAAGFTSLLPLFHVLATQREECTASQGLDVLIGCLRTMVNVTNHNEAWANLLTTESLLQTLCGTLNLCRQGYQKFMSKSDTPHSHPRAKDSELRVTEDKGTSDGFDRVAQEIVFDLICVTLGLLANLVEQCPKGKQLIRTVGESSEHGITL